MHKVSNDIKKWTLDESKLSKEDLEVLKIVNFPKKLGYRDAAQKRIKRLQGLKYVVTPKNIAKSQIQRYSASGTSTAEIERNKKFIEGILKAKSYKVEYIDAHYIEEEMYHILSLYSTPKPTPSMKVETVNNTKLNKKTKVKKQLTEAQKVTAKEKFQSGEMDIKELASHLKVTQTLLKEYLKSL
jgi:hypothetical protein